MRQLAPLLAGALLAAARAGAELPDDLEVGAYVEVEGALSGDGILAEEVEVSAVADSEARVRGRLDAVDARARSLSVGGVALLLDPGVDPTDAAGRALELSALEPGCSVDARGVYRDGALWLRVLSVDAGEGPHKLKLAGTIDVVDPDADAFRLLGVGVRLTPETWIELD